MPYFSTQPSQGIADSVRNLVSSLGGGNASAKDFIAADQAALQAGHTMAQTRHQNSVAEKVRAEVEQMRKAAEDRESPVLATEYGARASGIDLPAATQLEKSISGVRERPVVQNDDDGNTMPDITFARPAGVSKFQEAAYQAARASLLGNRLATGKTDALQLAKAGGEIQEQGITSEVQNAIAAGKMMDASAMNQGGKIGNAIKLYDNVGDTGATFAPSTGAVQADPAAQPGNSLLRGTLDKIAADIGLRGAQTGSAKAAAVNSYSNADLHRAQADKVRNPPAKGTDGASFKDVTTLRKEFNDQKEVVAFRDVIPIIESARATPDSRAGDIQIAYAVGKILDPASVVREGELKLVGNAATLPEKLQGELRTLVMGKGRMTPDTRAKLLEMLDVAVTQRETAYKAAEDTYRGIAKQNGFPEDQVIINAPKRKPAAPETTRVVNGVTFVKSGGQWYQK